MLTGKGEHTAPLWPSLHIAFKGDPFFGTGLMFDTDELMELCGCVLAGRSAGLPVSAGLDGQKC